MNKRIILIVTLIACLQLCGCGSEDSAESSNIVGASVDANCFVNNTGELLYKNSTNDNFFVSINGLNYGVIKPGQILRANLDAGFQVTADSLWVDGTAACSGATVPIIQCQSRMVDCFRTR